MERMTIWEWTLNEKILLEKFKNHCAISGMTVSKNWKTEFEKWKLKTSQETNKKREGK